MLKNARLLMTGLTGQLAGSIAAILAPHNEIYGLARYSKPGSKEAVEALGITPIVCDYTSGDFTGVPNDFDYVFHAAADVFPADIETGLKQNAEGTGLLLQPPQPGQGLDLRLDQRRLLGPPRPVVRLPGDRPLRRKRPDQHPLRVRHQQVRRRGGRPVAVPHPQRAADGRPDELVLRPGELRRHAGQDHHPGGAGGARSRSTRTGSSSAARSTRTTWPSTSRPSSTAPPSAARSPTGAATTRCRSSSSSRGWRSSSAPRTPSPAWTEIIAYPRNLDPARRTSLTGPCKVKWQDGFRRIIEERFPGRLAMLMTT